jgi:hypothetical protein
MSTTITMKRGDLLPALAATLSNEAGVFNLTGATVDVLWRPAATGLDAIEGTESTATAQRRTAAVVSEVAGTVSYAWVAGDTDTAGTFDLEFEITVGGKTLSFPNDGFIRLIIEPDLD